MMKKQLPNVAFLKHLLENGPTGIEAAFVLSAISAAASKAAESKAQSPSGLISDEGWNRAALWIETQFRHHGKAAQ